MFLRNSLNLSELQFLSCGVVVMLLIFQDDFTDYGKGAKEPAWVADLCIGGPPGNILVVIVCYFIASWRTNSLRQQLSRTFFLKKLICGSLL